MKDLAPAQGAKHSSGKRKSGKEGGKSGGDRSGDRGGGSFKGVARRSNTCLCIRGSGGIHVHAPGGCDIVAGFPVQGSIPRPQPGNRLLLRLTPGGQRCRSGSQVPVGWFHQREGPAGRGGSLAGRRLSFRGVGFYGRVAPHPASPGRQEASPGMQADPLPTFRTSRRALP